MDANCLNPSFSSFLEYLEIFSFIAYVIVIQTFGLLR